MGIDTTIAAPCEDWKGETDISIAGENTCEQLARYCEYSQVKMQVSEWCPKSCGSCISRNYTAKSNLQCWTKLDETAPSLFAAKLLCESDPSCVGFAGSSGCDGPQFHLCLSLSTGPKSACVHQKQVLKQVPKQG